MWILKSRRLRAQVLYLLVFLFGTTIVAGTAMLGSTLLSLNAQQASRENSEYIAALALLDGMDEFDHTPAASEPARNAAGDRFDEDAPAGPMIVSTESANEEALDDDPTSTVASDTPNDSPSHGDGDTSSDLPDEQEEYAGAPGGPPAGLDAPNPGSPNGAAPQTPSSPPIAGLPPVSTPHSGPPPARRPSPAPTAQPFVIAATPPAAPSSPSGPAPSSPQTSPYSPPVVVVGAPTAPSSATPPASPGVDPGNTDPVGTTTPGQADPGPVIASNPTGESGGPTDDWYSPGSSPGVKSVDQFTLGGRTLIIEFVSSEPGLGFDVLQVEGTANLDYGNIVFAFLNGYQPEENLTYEFLQAQEIIWGDVDVFYGLLDSSQTEDGDNAPLPLDWNLYSLLDESTFDIFEIVADYTFGDASLALKYSKVASDRKPVTDARLLADPNTIPSPDVLNLLLSGGLGLLLVTFVAKRRQNPKRRDHDNQAA